jgi:hypothetical protein
MHITGWLLCHTTYLKLYELYDPLQAYTKNEFQWKNYTYNCHVIILWYADPQLDNWKICDYTRAVATYQLRERYERNNSMAIEEQCSLHDLCQAINKEDRLGADGWGWRTQVERINQVSGGYNWSTTFLSDLNMGIWASGLASLKFETVKYNHELCRTWARKWLCWQCPPAVANYRPILSSERSLHINKPATVWQ